MQQYYQPQYAQQPMMPQQQPMPMNMYQPQPQQVMMQPQQPYGFQQPQQQMQPVQPLTMEMAQQALAKYVQAVANSPINNALTGYMYTRYSQSQWTDSEFTGAAMIVYAIALGNLQRAPGLGAQQALSQAVADAYEINAILILKSQPQMMQYLPPDMLQTLLQNLPRLQQTLNQALGGIGKQSFPLEIPNYQVQQVSTGIQPLHQGMMMPQQQMMQPGMMQQPQPMQSQYGIQPLTQTAPPVQPGQQSGYVQNLGYSNARAVIPPSAGEAHFGIKPLVETRHEQHSLVSQRADRELGITARQPSLVGADKPLFEPLIKTAPVQHQQPVTPIVAQQQPQYQQPVQAHWNAGVQESYSTPHLEQAINDQLANLPSDINFDAIASLSNEEEEALFNPPSDDNDRPMPSMTELFGQTFGVRNDKDPLSFMNMSTDPVDPTYLHTQPEYASAEAMQGLAQPVTHAVPSQLSADGLPDGWLFTEKFYDAPSEDFFNLFKKAKRNATCPWPIGYDRRFCTRLYRYMENGSIEQKIVGVPMDRLKHDISLLDTAVPTDKIYEAERADFGSLTTMSTNEAVKIIKTPDVTEQVINEKLEDKDIFLIDKPIVAMSRQEALLLGSAKTQPLSSTLKEKHGFETQIRECLIITQRQELTRFMELPEIKAISQDSTVKDVVELSEAIRNIRHAGLLNERSLHRVTEHMRDIINTILYADYGYVGTVSLTDDQLFEDELIEFVNYMNQSEENLDVLNRIHAEGSWSDVRAKLCALLTGEALHNAQQQLARRYDLPEEEREAILETMGYAVILEKTYTITTIARTTKQLRISDNKPAFVTMPSDRPYLHQLMIDIKKRSKVAGRVQQKHIIITKDGVELGFAQSGLGRGDTFPTYYI